jgi:hypothetical protein
MAWQGGRGGPCPASTARPQMRQRAGCAVPGPINGRGGRREAGRCYHIQPSGRSVPKETSAMTSPMRPADRECLLSFRIRVTSFRYAVGSPMPSRRLPASSPGSSLLAAVHRASCGARRPFSVRRLRSEVTSTSRSLASASPAPALPATGRARHQPASSSSAARSLVVSVSCTFSPADRRLHGSCLSPPSNRDPPCSVAGTRTGRRSQLPLEGRLKNAKHRGCGRPGGASPVTVSARCPRGPARPRGRTGRGTVAAAPCARAHDAPAPGRRGPPCCG